jgi:hypothetical protein
MRWLSLFSWLKSALPPVQNGILLTWAVIQALLSTAKIPTIKVGFFPFILRSVADHSTVYTTMLNLVKFVNQLEQKSLLLFSDEGVFRIVVAIMLACPIDLQTVVPCLCGFHHGLMCTTLYKNIYPWQWNRRFIAWNRYLWNKSIRTAAFWNTLR